jgi:hypothetical protein
MKLGLLNIVKIFCLCIFVLFITFSDNTQTKPIKVGEITNEIKLGPFAGKRNLAVGVKNILEEYLQESGYELNPTAEEEIAVKLVFFDVKNIGKNIGIYHNDASITEIIAIGELKKNGKVIKKTIQKGQSKEVSVSTLIVADDGTFNQQTASIALKKVLEAIIKDLSK